MVTGDYRVIATTGNGLAATFIIKVGIHLQQSIIPKSGDRFFGEPGAGARRQGVAS
jgi:hypothetical protein